MYARIARQGILLAKVAALLAEPHLEQTGLGRVKIVDLSLKKKRFFVQTAVNAYSDHNICHKSSMLFVTSLVTHSDHT